MSPQISTFGIGSYCNHYFLRMLAAIGGGHYDAAYDVDSIETRMQRLFARTLSTILANINIDAFDHVDEFEVYPFNIADLSNRSPLVVSGRYRGNFPDYCKATGTLLDLTNFVTQLKVQRTEAIPLNKVRFLPNNIRSSYISGMVFRRQTSGGKGHKDEHATRYPIRVYIYGPAAE
ncbi:hypothetical protein QJS10_CPA01g01235 [Acorus calamus]|uniref:Uncharacterized protein n=1 Tax=Acorus calamus TaxID=4465 RepID=A0AAV9FGV4_ACOCL|nr:hypothetical protein QJS10_CPA01g01235 [Acorus calamus]